MPTLENDYMVFDSHNEGPKSAIFVGVHGDEVCGIYAVQELLKNFSLDKGSVIFVFGNPKAIEKGTRYVDFNLNRSFKEISEYTETVQRTYEFKRAQELKKYLETVDVLLDVHSSGSISSEPFIICEENADDIVNAFSERFTKIVHGFDALQSGGTDYYMNSIGKIGICIECGSHQDPNAKDLAKETIVRFLEIRGHFNKNIEHKKSIDKTRIQLINLYYTQSDNFTLVKEFADFEMLPENFLFANDGGREMITPEKCLILFARNKNQVGQ